MSSGGGPVSEANGGVAPANALGRRPAGVRITDARPEAAA